MKPETRLLRVTCNRFVAAAEFEKRDGSWIVTMCPPILRRAIVGHAIEQIPSELRKLGATWEWMKDGQVIKEGS